MSRFTVVWGAVSVHGQQGAQTYCLGEGQSDGSSSQDGVCCMLDALEFSPHILTLN